MKARKIAALLLTVIMLVSCAPVLAEETPESTVQVTSAPVQVTPVPTEKATETPAEESVMVISEAEQEETSATEVPATEVPATEVPATEVPATEVPATEVPATEVPATEVPATDAPATEVPATDAPATEAPVYEPVYARISRDVKLFSDKELTESIGELTGEAILRVIVENETTGLYRVLFDTEESIKTDAVETAYFRAAQPLNWLTEAETEKALETMKTFRKAGGESVPYIDFKYPEPDPTEAPTEEPTDAPAVDEDGKIIEDLATIEPDPTEEPELDEDGKIIEDLTSAETEESAETEVPAETEEPAYEDLPSVEDVLIDETAPEETVVEAESAETAVPECSVVASMYAASETVALGDTVTVKAELIGYEGLTYTCEWECAATDETGAVTGEWQTTGITELEHSFVLDETTAQLAWHLRTVVEA